METRGCSADPHISGGCAAVVGDALYTLCGFNADDQERTNSVYRLDLHTMEWERVEAGPHSELPSPRDKFCTWVFEKRIFVFGGFGPPARMKAEFVVMDGYSGWNNSVHVLNTKTSEWSELITKGSRPCPRAAHAGTTYASKGYVFGGRFQDRRMNDLHCLDLETGTWSGQINTVGIQPQGRSWHSLSLASSTFLFLYGGLNTQNEILGDGWIFNLPTCEWIQVVTDPPCVPTRMWHTSCSSGDGEVYVFGGSSTPVFTQEETCRHGKQMLIFKCAVSPLSRLCIDLIVHHPVFFQRFIPGLPVALRRQIEARLSS